MARLRARTHVGPCAVPALAAACLAGCGGALARRTWETVPGAGGRLALAQDDTRDDTQEAAFEAEGRPVADLSRAEVGLPKFFVGVAMCQAEPYDRSLESAFVYDVNVAWDVPSLLTFELIAGMWDLPDKPLPGADSTLEMTPIMGTVLLAKEIPAWRMRAYVGAGAGFSRNNYALGAGHRAAMLEEFGQTDYDATVEDSTLLQACVGAELYSTWDAKLNLALELRHVWSDIDITEYLEAGPRSDSASVKMWLLRSNITWHY